MSSEKLHARADIPAEETWNVASIYPNIETWKKAFSDVEESLKEIDRYRGRLGSGPRVLLDWLHFSETLRQKIYHLYIYASLNYSVDTTNQDYAALMGMMGGLAARTGGAKLAVGAGRVTLWGALAMAATAAVGAIFGTVV